MEDGFQILLYVVAGVVWVISSVISNKKQKAKRTPMRSPSLPTETSIDDFETILEEDQAQHIEEIVEEFVEEKKEKVAKTFFDRDPYKDSVKHKARKKRLAKLKVIVPEDKEDSPGLDVTEIDWTKAVIYSEILRPRF
ncbi:hypothetical protein C7377_0749 [Balneicella halophila]|uniref:Uncharacterized protein n=1 Tax=Balneicella halophila TaxID=1537566 RepID=A0A7L4URN2_BALHA|nr:hypothetical protein [Balneicella halophila]PVX52435.1 hypothetical protein C7377_0749 [Balneicella halophila]